jgi:hypothetical protein
VAKPLLSFRLLPDVDCCKGSTESSARRSPGSRLQRVGKNRVARGWKLFRPRKSPPPACFANDRPPVDLVSSPAVTNTPPCLSNPLAGAEIVPGARKKVCLVNTERSLSEVRAETPKKLFEVPRCVNLSVLPGVFHPKSNERGRWQAGSVWRCKDRACVL